MGCLKRVQEVIEQIKVLLTQDQMQHDTADWKPDACKTHSPYLSAHVQWNEWYIIFMH